MAERILVTGATGTIGRELVRLLSERGAAVVAGVTSEDKASALESQGVRAEVFSYSDAESLGRIMEGKARVFLLLPFTEGMKRWGLAALDAAKAAGVAHVVRSSALLADTEAHFQLGKVHGGVDLALEESGLSFTILRPNVFMQNYALRLSGEIREKNRFSLPEADNRTSFIDARDIAACAATVLLDPAEHAGRTYLLTGPEALSNMDVAAILSAEAGREIAYRPLSEEQAREKWMSAGLPEWSANMLLGLARQVREGVTGMVTGAVKHLSGRDPVPFRQFARDFRRSWI